MGELNKKEKAEWFDRQADLYEMNEEGYLRERQDIYALTKKGRDSSVRMFGSDKGYSKGKRGFKQNILTVLFYGPSGFDELTDAGGEYDLEIDDVVGVIKDMEKNDLIKNIRGLDRSALRSLYIQGYGTATEI